MNNQPTSQKQKPSNGYGKRPIWFWIVVYIIIGAIVYGLIYLFIVNMGGYNNQNNGSDGGDGGGGLYRYP